MTGIDYTMCTRDEVAEDSCTAKLIGDRFQALINDINRVGKTVATYQFRNQLTDWRDLLEDMRSEAEAHAEAMLSDTAVPDKYAGSGAAK